MNAREVDPLDEIWRLTGGQGVDVALELVGLRQTVEQAVRSLGVFGRAVLAGIADQPFELGIQAGVGLSAVEQRHLVALVQRGLHQGAPQEARAAEDQELHFKPP